MLSGHSLDGKHSMERYQILHNRWFYVSLAAFNSTSCWLNAHGVGLWHLRSKKSRTGFIPHVARPLDSCSSSSILSGIKETGKGCVWISFLHKKIRFMVSGGPLNRQEKTRCLRMHSVTHKQGAWRAKLRISVLFRPREFFIWSLNQIKIILVHFEWWWWNYWVYFVCFLFFFLKYEAT